MDARSLHMPATAWVLCIILFHDDSVAHYDMRGKLVQHDGLCKETNAINSYKTNVLSFSDIKSLTQRQQL